MYYCDNDSCKPDGITETEVCCRECEQHKDGRCIAACKQNPDTCGDSVLKPEVGDRVVFLLFNKETLGVVTKIDGYDVWIDAGAGEHWMCEKDIVQIIV